MVVGLGSKRAQETDFWLVFFDVVNSRSNEVIIPGLSAFKGQLPFVQRCTMLTSLQLPARR